MSELKRQRIKSIVEQSSVQRQQPPWSIVVLLASVIALLVALSVVAVA